MKDFIEKIRISDEKDLLSYMEEVFNATAVNFLLTYQDRQEKDRFLSNYVRGYHLPLSPQLGGRLHTISQDIIGLLDYTDRPVSFYISNNPEFNAAAYFNHNEDEPHYIVLNSGLVDKLSEDEMRFVIGHEVGHLIYEHSVFKRVVEYIYPHEAPPFLTGIYLLWANLSEMSADRVGLLAARDFETALGAMFKMSCGLDMMHFQVDTKNFMNLTDSIVKEMMAVRQNYLEGLHPANPVRIKALDCFYRSRLRQSFLENRQYVEDEELNEKTDELISLLQKRPLDDVEYAKLDFLTATGYSLIKSDEDIAPEECDELMNILSHFYYWPPAYLDSLRKDGNLTEIIDKSSAYIVENVPQDVRLLFNALIPLVMKDRRIKDEEINELINIAEKLKIPTAEVVETILDGIRQLYKPLS